MSQFVKVFIEYTFQLEKYLKISSGNGKNSYVDNAIRTQVDHQRKQLIEIPGTSAKGRIRANFEKVTHLLPADYSNDIFGASGQQGWAHFSSLTCEKPPKVGIATSTAIDRFRKGAKNKSLRVEEFTQTNKGNPFMGTIDGTLLKTEPYEKQVAALLLALLQVDRFGGDKSVGFGKGKTQIKRVIIDGKEWATNVEQQIMTQLVE